MTDCFRSLFFLFCCLCFCFCFSLCCLWYKRKTSKQNHPNKVDQGTKLLEKPKEAKENPQSVYNGSNSQNKASISPLTASDPSLPPFDQQFTKEFVLKLTEKEFSDSVNYEQFYSKNNMTFHIRKNGSIYSTEFPTVRMYYTMKKSEFPSNTTVKDLCIYMNSPAVRRTWDKTMKDYQIIKGDEELYILHTVMNSPVFFISERDMVMKRIDFFHGNDFYFFSRSTAAENVAELPNIIRMDTIYNAFKIEDKDDLFHFQSLAQLDFKMNLPQSVFNITMPITLMQWYKDIKTKMNKDHEPKKTD